MANRVMSASDVASRPWATVGDILLDAGTSTSGDGRIGINLQNMSVTFATCRFGPNIWVDGSIGTFFNFRLQNGTDSDSNPEWVISDAQNPVHIRPVPGTKVRVWRNGSSNSGYTFQVTDIKYVVVDGENDAWPGLRDGWPNSGLLTGNFGFEFMGHEWSINSHMMSMAVKDGGLLKIRGCECQGGFSAIRFQGGYYDITTSIQVERCYLHNAGDGEGFYLGATHVAPYAKLKVKIKDCIIANRACESIQIQHITSEFEVNNVENFVAFCSAMDGINAFQGGQDTCIQWDQARGGSRIKNGIVDGSAFTSVALNHFSSSNVVDRDTSIPAIAENTLFWGIGGILSYIHNSNTKGVWRVMKNLYAGGFSNRYYYGGLNNLDNYYVSTNNGTDKFSWINIKHDNVKATFFEDASGHEAVNISTLSMPAPEYINSGFTEPSSNIMNWKATYANYHDDATLDKPVTYEQGWIVVNIEQGVEYAYYLVTSTHTTSGLAALTPRADVLANGNVRYRKLTWDSNGKRNYLNNNTLNPDWNAGLTQSNYPPHDLRLVANSFWNKKGMGLGHNPQNTDYTQYQWFRNTTASSAGAKTIPGAKSRFYTPQDADLGKYIALGVKAKDANYDAQWRYSNWTLVSPQVPTYADIVHRGTGVIGEGTTSVSVPYPVGLTVNAGDAILINVITKIQTARAYTPAGFRRLKETISWTGSNATDRGPIRITTFFKQAVGGETGSIAITIQEGATSGAVAIGYLSVFQKDAAANWNIEVVAAAHHVADGSLNGVADISARSFSKLDSVGNDKYFVFTGVNANTHTWSAQALSQPGATLTAVSQELFEGGSSLGNDVYAFGSLFNVSGPAPSGHLTFTATSSGVGTGNPVTISHLIRLRQSPTVQSFKSTNYHLIDPDDMANSTVNVEGGIWNNMRADTEGTTPNFAIETYLGEKHLVIRNDITQYLSQIQRRQEFHLVPWMPRLRPGTKEFIGFKFRTNGLTLPSNKGIIFLQLHTGDPGTSSPHYPVLYFQISYTGQFGDLSGGRLVIAHGLPYPGHTYSKFESISFAGTKDHNFQVFIKHDYDGFGRLLVKYNGATIFDQTVATIAQETYELGDGTPGTGSDADVGGTIKMGCYHHMYNTQADAIAMIGEGHSEYKAYYRRIKHILKDPTDVDYGDEYDIISLSEIDPT